MRMIVINGRPIGDDLPPYVIAELGANHMGDFQLCLEMIRVAAHCGADAVKLQKRDNRAMFTKAMYRQPYNSEEAYGDTYGRHRDALDWFGRKEYIAIAEECRHLGVAFICSAFDEPSADFLATIDLAAVKIASCDVTNLPLIYRAARLGLPVILSTGGADMEQIDTAMAALWDVKAPTALLHCVSTYPNQDGQLNLRVIENLRKYYQDTVIGFSSHHPAVFPNLLAWSLGARIFEVHFTLSRANRGTDHKYSLEPGGLEKLCTDLRRCSTMLGDGVKRVLDAERRGFVWKMGKSIWPACTIPAGKRIEASDVTIKAPADGLPPSRLNEVVGRIAIVQLSTDHAIQEEDLTYA